MKLGRFGRRHFKVVHRKRFKGLILFFVGVGMVIQFMMPGWGFLIAAALIIAGFWLAYTR